MKFYWTRAARANIGCYAGFRAKFCTESAGGYTLRVFGASWFSVRIDGEFITEGPCRFPAAYPEYEELKISLGAGEHVLAARVHDEHVSTRLLAEMPPFFGAQLLDGAGKEIPLSFRARELPYAPHFRRINPQLGWSEDCDLGAVPFFESPGFDDSAWEEAVPVTPEIGALSKARLGHIRPRAVDALKIGEGVLAENFGYENDDVPARFYLRYLNDETYPKEGIWLRYDLGKVRLFRFTAEIDAPAGTLFEIAYAETLQNGRVSPLITLSAGDSCNLDRYRLAEGKNFFGNLTPRGGRYAEIHILGDADKIRVRSVNFLERTYFGAPCGAFESGDELLDKIWRIGAETFRSCSEDALVDTPTRERGEWTGDVIGAGIEICNAAFGDMRMIRRGLVQAAQCAAEDGCVAGLCPGGVGYLSTYALQWVRASWKFFRMTGDREYFTWAFDAAKRNMRYFAENFTNAGCSRDVHWAFVDWGYVTNEGESDMGVNLHLHNALRAYVDWCEWMGDTKEKAFAEEFLGRVRAVIAAYLVKNAGEWEKIGMHRAVLALGEGFFEGQEAKDCVAYVKRHYLSCFPNDMSAPRLGAPDKNNPRLITPYFSHFAFPILWQAGEGDFVISQYKTCWGWLAAQDNTWLEVFDGRWSHCHQWSGCPTWQLSRYCLGLMPREDLAPRAFEYCKLPARGVEGTGKLPVAGGGTVEVRFGEDFAEYTPDVDITVYKNGVPCTVKAGESKMF